MTIQEIHSAALPNTNERASICLMDQEISGTKVICHVLPAGDMLTLAPSSEYIRILFVCSGDATIQSNGVSHVFSQRGLLIGVPNKELTVQTKNTLRY